MKMSQVNNSLVMMSIQGKLQVHQIMVKESTERYGAIVGSVFDSRFVYSDKPLDKTIPHRVIEGTDGTVDSMLSNIESFFEDRKSRYNTRVSIRINNWLSELYPDLKMCIMATRLSQSVTELEPFMTDDPELEAGTLVAYQPEHGSMPAVTGAVWRLESDLWGYHDDSNPARGLGKNQVWYKGLHYEF